MYKIICIIAAMLSSLFFSADWPMWRYDAGRSAASMEELPKDLKLQWVYELPPNVMTWQDEPRMTFGSFYEPIVAGKTMFVGSSQNDKITAIDIETCEEKWVFYTEGPVYFAPIFWQGKVYFASDDGTLYCVDAEKGSLIWKFKGGPSDLRVIGNERLISAWPIRGAPVLLDGKIYFTAGIWPFMGIFIYALDAETGKVIWSNSKTGSMYILQPHSSPAFAGTAPQGYIAATEDKLVIPNGRAVPAVFNRQTGEFLYFNLHENAMGGEYQTAASKKYFFNDSTAYDLKTGAKSGGILSNYGLVFTENAIYSSLDSDYNNIKNNEIRACSADNIKDILWKFTSEDAVIQIKAGGRLYAAGNSFVKAIEIPAFKQSGVSRANVSWKSAIKGRPVRIIAADKKLFVVTKEGSIYCFSGSKAESKTFTYAKEKFAPKDVWTDYAEKILKMSGVKEGYCVVLGAGTGRLIEELATGTKLCMIVIEADAKKAELARKRLDNLGLYGKRAAVLCNKLDSLELSPYLADLIVSEEFYPGSGKQENVKKIFGILRPYGGVAYFPVTKEKSVSLVQEIKKTGLQNAEIKTTESFVLLAKKGALPGSADWTHQNADASNTCVSKDDLVKAPLGLLWFGGPSSKNILPRHGHGPSEQVVGGRLFIQGPDMLRALDVYTGRLLWEKALPDLGKYYNVTEHQPGANAVGSNYVTVEDGVYVLYGNKCLRLAPATGEQISEFIIPDRAEKPGDSCGYIAVWKDLLIVSNSPILNKIAKSKVRDKMALVKVWKNVFSNQIMCLNRNSGEVLWKFDAESGFRHNAITIGNDKIFCIDNISDVVAGLLRQQGFKTKSVNKIIALDIRTGNLLWSTKEDRYGTWLSFSEEKNILLKAGRNSRDMLPVEPRDVLSAYNGSNGEILWKGKIEYDGPCMLHADSIYTGDGKAFNLMNGELKTYKNPVTDVDVPWQLSRNYGCNSLIASKHLITFRSAAAGYFDLDSNSGTGNLGGFKSGCTSNLIAADGGLNAPDYTNTCICSYHNQTSLGLIYMPENEMWTFNNLDVDAAIKRIGINFGAMGDRKDKDGTLWLDYPSVGGPSPVLPVTLVPAAPEYFCNHSSSIKQGRLKWVSSSGVKGVESVMVNIDKRAAEAGLYTVKLYFAEPENKKEGERVFDVSLQGSNVLEKFDIIKEAKAPNCEVIKTFENVSIKQYLKLEFSPIKESLLCGLEIIANPKK